MLFGVYAGIFCYASYGGIAVERAVEHCEDFFEAYGVEGVEMPKVVERAGFGLHALLHHKADSPVDAVKENMARHIDGEFLDGEGAGFFLTGAELAHGQAALANYFEGMNKTAMVSEVGLGIIFGVEALDFVAKGLDAVTFEEFEGLLPDIVGDGGERVEAVNQGVDIHH